MAIKKVFIGHNPPEGWVHVAPDNCSKLPFKNCAIDEVYVENVLEFMRPEQFISLINEWKRVIRVNGIFTIVFTDFVKSVFLYTRGVLSSDDIQKNLIDTGYKTFISKDRMENMLLMRYDNSHEIFETAKERGLHTTVLQAKKEIDNK